MRMHTPSDTGSGDSGGQLDFCPSLFVGTQDRLQWRKVVANWVVHQHAGVGLCGLGVLQSRVKML